MASRPGLPRLARRRAPRRHRLGAPVLPRVRSASRHPELRRRRRRRQGLVARPAAPAGVRRPRPALGDRLQVRADDGHHQAREDRPERGAHGGAQPVRDPRARRRRRRDRVACDPPQRGRHPAQGHPGGRPRHHSAGGRRDPAGGGAGTRAGRSPAQGVADARQLPGVLDADRPGRGRGAPLLPQPRLPVARVRGAEALRVARGDGHRRRRREARRPPRRARARLPAAGLLPPHRRPARPAGRVPGDAGRERHHVDRALEVTSVRPRPLRPRYPARRRDHRRDAGGCVRLDGRPAHMRRPSRSPRSRASGR